MKIIVDAMGGDNAPLQIVLGAVDALNQDKNLKIVLVGDQNAIEQSLCECKEYDKSRLDIIDAKDVITNDDTPTTAIRTKKESSLVKAFDALVHDEEAGGFISGNYRCSTTLWVVVQCKCWGWCEHLIMSRIPTSRYEKWECTYRCGFKTAFFRLDRPCPLRQVIRLPMPY